MSDTVESPPPIWIESKIREMVQKIVDRFHPEKVILFGSHARGNAGPWSDVDLLVVLRTDRAKKSEQAMEMYVVLMDSDLPKDVVVVTPEEMESQRDIVGTIVYPAVREGRVLYERPA